MTKKNVIRVALVSACLLIIPLLGNMFIDGWNWSPGDFVFAFVFFCITGLALTYAQIKVTSRPMKITASAIILFVMITIWVMLATG